jgi:hypothetical protein
MVTSNFNNAPNAICMCLCVRACVQWRHRAKMRWPISTLLVEMDLGGVAAFFRLRVVALVLFQSTDDVKLCESQLPTMRGKVRLLGRGLSSSLPRHKYATPLILLRATLVGGPLGNSPFNKLLVPIECGLDWAYVVTYIGNKTTHHRLVHVRKGNMYVQNNMRLA